MSPYTTSNSRYSSTTPVVTSARSSHSSEKPTMQTRRQQRRSGLLVGISGSGTSQRVKARNGLRKSLRKLEIPDTAGLGGSGLTTPFGTRWTVAGVDPWTPLTPFNAIATQSYVVLPVVEVRATWRQANVGHQGNRTPTATTGSPRWAAPTRLANYHHNPGQPAARGGSSISQTNEEFQKFRQDFWKNGPKVFGDPLNTDVFVRAFQLPRASPSEEGKMSEKEKNEASSSSVLAAGRLTVRAVIHSKQRAAVGLTRQFDLEKLQATIPAEPLSSPHSPDFDREALFSALRTPHDFAIANGSYLSSRDVKREPGEEPSSYCEDLVNSAIPMHFPYARANLPALAAIMMSDKVGQGDVVDLVVPQLKAWLETVAYVYTGEGELLTKAVRENILYLGGRV